MDNRAVSRELISFFMEMGKAFKEYSHNEKDSIITHQQFLTIANLKHLGKRGLKEISKDMKVSTSSLCIMLNKLVESGYAQRETDPNDRRNTLYSITEKGEELFEEEVDKKLYYIDVIIDKLSEESKEKFYNSIIQLKEIVKEIEE